MEDIFVRGSTRNQEYCKRVYESTGLIYVIVDPPLIVVICQMLLWWRNVPYCITVSRKRITHKRSWDNWNRTYIDPDVGTKFRACPAMQS